jgi:hypothetical protein
MNPMTFRTGHSQTKHPHARDLNEPR